MKRPEVFCLPCALSSGQKTKAIKLAPQIEETPVGVGHHWVPICDGCADGWFDPSEPESESPGPILPLHVVLHQKEKK